MMRGMARFNLKDFAGAKEDLEKAKKEAEKLTEDAWHSAYPGNHPSLAGAGFTSFMSAIEENLVLVNRELAGTE